MCEQCIAETELFGEVIPGYFLVRATQNGEFMYPGDWGLVTRNDPDIVWSEILTPNPIGVLSYEERKLLEDDDNELQNNYANWRFSFNEFDEALDNVNITYGWTLFEACIKLGFDPKQENVCNFLVHKIGVFLSTPEMQDKIKETDQMIADYLIKQKSSPLKIYLEKKDEAQESAEIIIKNMRNQDSIHNLETVEALLELAEKENITLIFHRSGKDGAEYNMKEARIAVKRNISMF